MLLTSNIFLDFVSSCEIFSIPAEFHATTIGYRGPLNLQSRFQDQAGLDS